LGKLRAYRSGIRRLRLRIACRTADWPQALASGLPELWGTDSYAAYQLAPLTQQDIAVAADSFDVDGEEFIAQVASREVQPLALKPITLKFLLSLFKGFGEFPSSNAQLYLDGCRLLCQDEPGSFRKETGLGRARDPDRLLAISARIAAIAMLCNRPVVRVGQGYGGLSDAEVPVRQLTGGREEVSDNQFVVEEPEVLDALETGLFVGRGEDRRTFAHHSYAEFLAAHHLATHDLALPQSLDLIQRKSGEDRMVVPQLAEVAAWLAEMDAGVFEALVQTEPQVLLHCDGGTLDSAKRARLAEVLLRLFEQRELTDSKWGGWRRYSKLAHPGIGPAPIHRGEVQILGGKTRRHRDRSRVFGKGHSGRTGTRGTRP